MSGEAIAEIGNDKPREECGIIGIYSNVPRSLTPLVYEGLLRLQHRGREAAGISLPYPGEILEAKTAGTVDMLEVEDLRKLATFLTHTALGHVRYGTVSPDVDPRKAAAPNTGKSRTGISVHLGHNGNIIRQRHNQRRYLTDSGLLQHNLADGVDTEQDLPEVAEKVLQDVEGGFALAIATPSQLVGVLDRNAIRPAVLGRFRDRSGYVIASESPAVEAIGAEFIRELDPGEMVIIDRDGVRSKQIFKDSSPKRCVFESIYFSRPDARIHGTSVQQQRRNMGRVLAQESPVSADLVVGVPDSGIPAALGYSFESGIPMDFGFVRNRFSGSDVRSFIAPTDELRISAVRRKLTVDSKVVKGKILIVVDDSIVRGITSREIVQMLKEAGAKEVHLRITAAENKYPCFYGVDMNEPSQLLANQMTIPEMEAFLGVKSLAYLSLDGLTKALGQSEETQCRACFTGNYPTPTPRVAMQAGEIPDANRATDAVNAALRLAGFNV